MCRLKKRRRGKRKRRAWEITKRPEMRKNAHEQPNFWLVSISKCNKKFENFSATNIWERGKLISENLFKLVLRVNCKNENLNQKGKLCFFSRISRNAYVCKLCEHFDGILLIRKKKIKSICPNKGKATRQNNLHSFFEFIKRQEPKNGKSKFRHAFFFLINESVGVMILGVIVFWHSMKGRREKSKKR